MWDLLAGAAGNVSANITSGLVWEPQPSRRGTFGILSTCFVTLALCTWKIVHLNLPGACPDDDLPWSAWWKPDLGLGGGGGGGGGSSSPPSSGPAVVVVPPVKVSTGGWRHRAVHILGGHAIVRRIGWLLIGLFAPELIAFAAFEQYWDVQSLQTFMEQVYVRQDENKTTRWWPTAVWNRSRNPAAADDDIERRDEDDDDVVGRRTWTLTHSWYAIMGGYSYDLVRGEGPAARVYLPDDHGRRRVVLRDEALRFVAVHEPSVIPRLPEAAILDKSGAGTFVKVVALFQALWFSLQCVVRMSQGLSISLLELTTFAHCVVALIIGWLWLRKPLDIREPDPLVIPDDDDDDDDDDDSDGEVGEGPKKGETAHWLMAILYTLTSFDGDEEADEDKWRKLSPGQSARLQVHAEERRSEKDTASSPVYLQPLGDHGPLSFAELGWDQQQQQQQQPEQLGSPSRPTSSRPLTAATADRPATSPRSPLAVAPPSKSHPAQSLSELIHSAADAEHRLRIRMALAEKGWEYYILNSPRSSSPTTALSPTTTSPSAHRPETPILSAEEKSSQQQQPQEGEEDPLALQRDLRRTLRNALVDRVPNFPRGRHQPTTKQYQSSHHHHHQQQQQQPQQHPTTSITTTAEQHRHTVRTHLGITLAGFLYGGLHLLAWDATFTSAAERALWRAAALSLAASGLLVPVSHAEGYVGAAVRPWLAMDEADRDAEEAAHLREKAQEILLGGGGGGGGDGEGEEEEEEEKGKSNKKKHRNSSNMTVVGRRRKVAWEVYRWCFLWMVEVARVLRVAALVLFALVYFGLRLFVFLECLVNLVHLPESAYEVVQWSQYVPHIS